MARTLTTNTALLAARTGNVTPITVLEIMFPDSGARYFSEQTIEETQRCVETDEGTADADMVEVPGLFQADLQAQITIDLWIKVLATPAAEPFRLLWMAAPGTDNTGRFMISCATTGGNAGVPYLTLYTADVVVVAAYGPATSILDGEWHHVRAEIDSTNDIIQVWTDGANGVKNTGGSPYPSPGIDPANANRAHIKLGYGVQARLADFRIQGGLVTAIDATFDVPTGALPTTDDTIRHYRLNDGLTDAESESTLEYILDQSSNRIRGWLGRYDDPWTSNVTWAADWPVTYGDGLSPQTAYPRLKVFGSIDKLISGGARPVSGDLRMEIWDGDFILRTLWRGEKLERNRATVYQYFAGLEIGDLEPLISGAITEPVLWEEREGVVRLDIEDIGAYWNQDVGYELNVDDQEDLWREHEGRLIPIVYGKARRVQAVCITGGAITTVTKAFSAFDESFIVDDAEDFPQNESIEIQIGKEIIQGSFDGNTFTVTERGRPLTDFYTTSRCSNSPNKLISNTLPMSGDNLYVGFWIELYAPYGRTVRRILWSMADEDTLFYSPPFTKNLLIPPSEAQSVGMFLDVWTIPNGWRFRIISRPVHHEATSVITQRFDSYVYAVADGPSASITKVETPGKRNDPITGSMPLNQSGSGIAVRTLIMAEERGLITLSNELYTVDRNDTSTISGRTVTTISMPFLPTQIGLDGDYDTNDIYVTLEGVDDNGDGTGTVLENPADIIKDILVRHGTLTEQVDYSFRPSAHPQDFDEASFIQAATDLGGLVMAFAVFSKVKLTALLADLAFQSKSMLLWESGKARLRVLTNTIAAAVTTVTTSTIMRDSLVIGRIPLSEIITELSAVWYKGYGPEDRDRRITIEDETATALYRLQRRDVNFWAYNDARHIRHITDFWLRRWGRQYDTMTFDCALTEVKVERDDIIAIDWDTHLPSGQKGWVRRVSHHPGSAAGLRGPGRTDGMTIESRLPRWAGCSSSCELACETGGCEAGDCEVVCETASETTCWACEGTCQTGCELDCTDSCQDVCVTVCQLAGCVVNCVNFCRTDIDACTAGCETHDETECSSCESIFETWDCLASCESTATESECGSSETSCNLVQDYYCITQAMTGCVINTVTKPRKGSPKPDTGVNPCPSCQVFGCMINLNARDETEAKGDVSCSCGAEPWCLLGCITDCQEMCEGINCIIGIE